MDFGTILDSKSYGQVCKYASMPVCQYARMQVYTCLHKKLNKKKDRVRPYPRLRDFFKTIPYKHTDCLKYCSPSAAALSEEKHIFMPCRIFILFVRFFKEEFV